jgi:NitT/TauT family transport system permease protein
MRGVIPISVEKAARGVSLWDALAILLTFGVLAFFAEGSSHVLLPLSEPRSTAISLEPSALPEYAARTTLRMLVALAISLLFTFTYATLAAKNRRAGLLLIPLLDILQSVPILGFISVTVVFFMSLVPGRVLGAEFAAIFAIFTSQAWNMAFSFYQSLRTVPVELIEASRTFRLSGWMQFWRVEVPFAIPQLIWNMMVSMSGSWFFVVASEAITVGNTTLTLPGVGSYLAAAIEQKNLIAVLWAVGIMLIVILVYDQLLFRPLVAWADRFRFEQQAGVPAPKSWVLDVLRRSTVGPAMTRPFGDLLRRINSLAILSRPYRPGKAGTKTLTRRIDVAWLLCLLAFAAFALWQVVNYVMRTVYWAEVGQAALLGFYTLIRVMVLILMATAIWLPIGVMLGLRPKLAQLIQPVAQFLAAFPANVLFPIAVLAIVAFGLDANVWLSLLMILGTQWYILFNVVAGAAAIPSELRDVGTNLQVKGWLWWRKIALPAVFPYYVTGAITASGGSWNASIVAEVASWGDTHLKAAGIGAYIAQATEAGDMRRVVLGIAVMSFYVVVINRLLWRPMYWLAERRSRMG